MYIYCSNESNVDVFFDNLEVIHSRGPLLEETHYYPFGLTMAGISSKAAGGMENKEKTFQGQRFDDELDLDWVQFKWRNHDPQIGRFIEIDPLSEDYNYNSTYAFSENKVTNHIELEGLESWFAQKLQDWTINLYGGKKDFLDGSEVLAKSNAGEYKEQGVISEQMHALKGSVQQNAGLLEMNKPAAEVYHAAASMLIGAEIPTEAALITGTPFKTAEYQGVNLTINAKATWDASQIAQAEAKAEALTKAETIVTKNPVARQANLRGKFVKAGGQVKPTDDVDHIVELQLGGNDQLNNLQALDKSVNRSFGSQIKSQIKNLPDNSKVNKVILIQPIKKQ